MDSPKPLYTEVGEFMLQNNQGEYEEVSSIKLREKISTGEVILKEYDPAIHPDGKYDTCPMYGPQVYMGDRRVTISNGTVVLNTHPECKFGTKFFFRVNRILERK